MRFASPLRPVLALLAVLPLAAAERVLVVHSYHEGYGWTDTIQKGIDEVLKPAGVEVKVVMMDAKRKTEAAERTKAGEAAKQVVAEWKPAVVITSDDAAQTFFAKDYAGKADAPQFVFCGVNAEAAKYGYPAANVTGLLERPHVTQCLEFVAKIVPGAKQVAFVSDPGEVTDAVIPYFKGQPQPVPVVAYDVAQTFDEWKALIAKHQDKDAILIQNYQSLKQGDGKADPKAVMAWTVANTKKPLVGIYDFAVRDGCVFGIAESALEHGQEAAHRAVAILKGKKAGELPISTAKQGLVMFNLTSAKALTVEIPFDLLELASETIGK
jgi:ABC-type uncharacterized transport system substrate-binding protein